MPKKDVVIKSSNCTQKAWFNMAAMSANLMWYDATVSTMNKLSAVLLRNLRCFFRSGCRSSDIHTGIEILQFS